VSELAEVDVRSDARSCHVRIRGDIDLSNARDLAERLEAAVPKVVDQVVLDLSTTRYMDSAGLGMLVRLHAWLHDRRQDVVVVATPGSDVRTLLELSGLAGALRIQDGLPGGTASRT